MNRLVAFDVMDVHLPGRETIARLKIKSPGIARTFTPVSDRSSRMETGVFFLAGRSSHAGRKRQDMKKANRFVGDWLKSETACRQFLRRTAGHLKRIFP
ncbi:hypothetical protein SH668x_001034 [Planctomicrobium sp. SH668]|uniref:hypothetical protein n=1 Tax=Planctomicrobium sp. SH668 TaxID=3448126 RepID=UPI003F5C8590